MNRILITGLGNPGLKYAKTRHNAGFLFLDFLKQTLNFEEFKNNSDFEAELSEGTYFNHKILLAKPQTFMNLSGRSIQKISRYFEIEPENIFVAFDDLDFELSKYKVQTEKAPRVHNGVNSVKDYIGNNFTKIRIGVENRDSDLKTKIAGRDYVLSKLTSDEIRKLEEIFPNIWTQIQLKLSITKHSL